MPSNNELSNCSSNHFQYYIIKIFIIRASGESFEFLGNKLITHENHFHSFYEKYKNNYKNSIVQNKIIKTYISRHFGNIIKNLMNKEYSNIKL